MRYLTITALLGVCICSSAAVDSTARQDGRPGAAVVKVEGGQVRGAALDGGISVYRGIPFAAPPVGDLRWKPPQPVGRWQGVRDCVTFGPACPQPEPALGGPIGNQSEDCLYLNVWTPRAAPGADLPVMVWIHGGGHTCGSGARVYTEGRNLAAHGVVVVTINYRLGPLGYLAHPLLSKESPRGVSGNYGMLDQIAALKWVRRNIAGFGGDPDRVTIFGESAGGASVSRLMICPEAKGLFHRAIAQSGGARGRNRHLTKTWYGMEPMEQVGERLAAELGTDKADDPLAALRRVSPEKLIETANPVKGLFGKGIKFGPIVDGWLIPDEPERMWQEGRQHDVPFMAGFNADEGTVFLRSLPIRRKRGYELLVRTMHADRAEDILRLFPAGEDKDVAEAMNKLVTVSSFAAPARFMTAAMERKKAPGYLYYFTKVSPIARTRGWGAFHGSEISYVFETGARMGFEDADTELAATIARTWARFAQGGNPNGEGLPAWAPHRGSDDRLMVFGAKVGMAENPHRQRCDLLDEITAERRKDPAVSPRAKAGGLRGRLGRRPRK